MLSLAAAIVIVSTTVGVVTLLGRLRPRLVTRDDRPPAAAQGSARA